MKKPEPDQLVFDGLCEISSQDYSPLGGTETAKSRGAVERVTLDL